MLKIGEFSKLSHLTVKALRFYERKGILIPKKVDEQTGYRFYETSQLKEAARITVSYTHLDVYKRQDIMCSGFNDINNQIVFKVHKDSRIFIFGVSREMKFINQ